jgi:hypothetical protein
MDQLTTEGYDFDIDAGWEIQKAPTRAICRWCFIYQYMRDDDDEIVYNENGLPQIIGVAAGYSGGGSFELERFYLLGDHPENISKLYLERGDEVIGDVQFGEWWSDIDPKIVGIAELAYQTFFKWHEEDAWSERDQLDLKLELRSDSSISEQDDMLYALTDDDNPWTKTVREYLGLTAGREFDDE